MKKTGKLLCALLAAALCLCTAACGKDEGPDASLSDASRKIGLGCVATRMMDGKDKTAVKATVRRCCWRRTARSWTAASTRWNTPCG